jgi:stress response protein YsnF
MLFVGVFSFGRHAMTVQGLDDGSEPEGAKVSVVEETAAVSTHEAVTGRVRVSTRVEPFEEMVQAILQSDTIEVTRVRIDKVVDVPPPVRTEGDVTIVPIFEEVLVVEKHLMLREELHIRKRTRSETFEEPVTLRRQQVTVERFDEEGNSVSPEEKR